jgi:hypothetical protein
VGSVDPEFKNQVHDFNPGIEPNGLFWTVRIPDDAVQVDLAAGTAEMHVRDFELVDAYNVPNAIAGGPSEPATVTFDVYWSDPTAVLQLSDAAAQVAGTFLDVTAALEFSARTADFAYVSDAADTSRSDFARIGYEANGAFFPTMGGTPTP